MHIYPGFVPLTITALFVEVSQNTAVPEHSCPRTQLSQNTAVPEHRELLNIVLRARTCVYAYIHKMHLPHNMAAPLLLCCVIAVKVAVTLCASVCLSVCACACAYIKTYTHMNRTWQLRYFCAVLLPSRWPIPCKFPIFSSLQISVIFPC